MAKAANPTIHLLSKCSCRRPLPPPPIAGPCTLGLTDRESAVAWPRVDSSGGDRVGHGCSSRRAGNCSWNRLLAHSSPDGGWRTPVPLPPGPVGPSALRREKRPGGPSVVGVVGVVHQILADKNAITHVSQHRSNSLGVKYWYWNPIIHEASILPSVMSDYEWISKWVDRDQCTSR